jgi:hypothetical protein
VETLPGQNFSSGAADELGRSTTAEKAVSDFNLDYDLYIFGGKLVNSSQKHISKPFYQQLNNRLFDFGTVLEQA